MLVAEHDVITDATGTKIAGYGAMLLAAYRGRVAEASTLIRRTIDDSIQRGEGLGVDLAHWSAAILNNGVGQYREALSSAVPAGDLAPGLLIATWMLPERIEAAVRTGQLDNARAAFEEFQDVANTADSDWGRGVRCAQKHC